MRTVNAYAAPSATEPLVKTTITRRDLGPNDVEIDIAYAGICQLGHPHRPRRVGRDPVPQVVATRSSATSPPSAATSPSTGSATVSGSAAW